MLKGFLSLILFELFCILILFSFDISRIGTTVMLETNKVSDILPTQTLH